MTEAGTASEVTKEDILKVIFGAIDEVNEMLSEEQRLEKSADSVIFGVDGRLDSMGLVNLVAVVEQTLMADLDVEVVLASEAAMSRKRSPYRSADALADYALELLSSVEEGE